MKLERKISSVLCILVLILAILKVFPTLIIIISLKVAILHFYLFLDDDNIIDLFIFSLWLFNAFFYFKINNFI